jgi:hypothetical protein
MSYDVRVAKGTKITPTRSGMRVTSEKDGVRTSVSPNGVGMSIDVGNGMRVTKPIKGKSRVTMRVGNMKISM